jgi:hypothetical protein
MFCRFIGQRTLKCATVAAVFSVIPVFAQNQSVAAGSREFRPGNITRVEDVPASRLRSQLDRLPVIARERAAAWLHGLHFTTEDLKTLRADPEGGIFYADTFTLAPTAQAQTSEPITAAATVPASPFPAGLIFHSKPGAPNVIYLNFSGATITNTAWNTSENRTSFQATAFSTDSDFTSFSDAEQAAIKRIWERVSEDYAPFNVDVTTEPPSSFTTRTAMALITRSTDSTGAPNPSSDAGGIAYINVFAISTYAKYRPAWIYYDNLASTESYIAEAASHEIGHNMGLSHDGLTSGADYYGGHGSSQTSWGPLMGTGYDRNVSQWSKGEYYLANNTQDDLAVISGKLSYGTDDRGDSAATATQIVITGGTNIVSTTPENDPTKTNTANRGILDRSTDVDVYSFSTGTGPINLTVNPWIQPSGTRGGNLDILAELRDANGSVVATNNPSSLTGAQIQTNLAAGTYYLFIRDTGAGDPLNSVPTGYTSYGSIGQYFISGYVAPANNTPATVQLIVTVNNPAWGSVTPSSGNYTSGTSVQVTATPADYYQFSSWTNGASGTKDPLTLVLTTNVSLQAIFSELLTTNHPTPLWWLAANGITTNQEIAVDQIGANGMPLWESYVAGLNPNNPGEQLRLNFTKDSTGDVLSWNTVTGRVYTVWIGTNLNSGFAPLAGAANLPATIQSATNTIDSPDDTRFYRIEVKKP